MKLIKFSVNNWAAGTTCPETANGIDVYESPLYNDSIDNFIFDSDDYCKEHKLCVYSSTVDMSFNSNVVAPEEWVKENWPEIIGSEFDCTDGTNKPHWEEDEWPEYKEENFRSIRFIWERAREQKNVK